MRNDTGTETITVVNGVTNRHLLADGLAPLKPFADQIGQLGVALDQLVQFEDQEISHSAQKLKHQLDGLEPAITMIGQVKSGKTTLVNAMAGWPDLLPADVNPWTSVVTSLHLDPGAERPKTVARFKFFNTNEWERLLHKGGRLGELANRAGADDEYEKIRAQIEAMREKSRTRLGKKFELLLGQKHEYGYFDKNLIERYICLGDFIDADEDFGEIDEGQGRFADITKSADLYLKAEAIPAKLCIRDTPGVNDTFMMREQVTIRAIRDSRICVVVLSAHQALSSVDMALIRLISNIQSRDVVIFVNRADELRDPAVQIPEIRASIQQTLIDQDGPADAKIIFGSAYWATRALADDVAAMAPESRKALDNLAQSMTDDVAGKDLTETAWTLSGLPELYEVLAERVSKGVGREALERISRGAINLAGSVNVSQALVIRGSEQGTRLAMDKPTITAAMDRIKARYMEALKGELDALSAAFNDRLDRAHHSFLDRATASLISHLETHGEKAVWSYSPTGLRLLLRSSYSVFGKNANARAKRLFDGSAAACSKLYERAFGGMLEEVRIEAPPCPPVPPPVFLSQTIALDIKGSWWSSWWRRRRGYRAYTDSFQEMIQAETDSLIGSMKNDQAPEICDEILRTFGEFLDDQRKMILNLTDKANLSEAELRDMLEDPAERERRENLEATMAILSRYAA